MFPNGGGSHQRSSFRTQSSSIKMEIVVVALGLLCLSDWKNPMSAGEKSGATTATSTAPQAAAATTTQAAYVVLGRPDLGMHCMNQDFSEICILPPFNNLRAQVIQRGEEPRIVTSNVKLSFSIPGNTKSSTKTNFWQYAPKLFGVNLANDVGLTGTRLTGNLTYLGNGDWGVNGIPITPLNDKLQNDPFQLSQIQVSNKQGKVIAKTVAVLPVSWEINCNLCHNTPGISVATDILRKHDVLHGTQLEMQKPVLCAKCHADPALGTTGVPGVKAFSHAMHGSHASRMSVLSSTKSNTETLKAALRMVDPKVAKTFSQLSAGSDVKTTAVVNNACYACHPGINTECQRDVHLSQGITCINCHGDMQAVGNVNRRPWVDEPTCGSCHSKLNPAFQYEEPGKLFKDSKGHGGVACALCHGPQHATGPATTAADNAQAILHQGTAGTIKKCTVCHTRQPSEPFFHSRDDD